MTSLTNEYFRLTLDYQTKYGPKTIVLMQVGAFFEMYGTKTDSSIMFDVCELCQLNTSDKRICVGNGDTVFMAGFRDYSLDKYVPRITDGGYTAVVYVQSKNDPKDRSLLAIYSPGTYISYETDSSPQITNHIMCVWFDKHSGLRGAKETLICGVAVANIFTGKSHMFEYESPYYINPTTFDELERCITINAPSELIVISPFDDTTLNTILQYSGVKTEVIHRFGPDSSDKIQNCMKQKYISHILSTFFGEESYSVCDEFGKSAIATQAFCYLMDFIQEHNPNLVRKISMPTFQNTSDRMVLANHTLKQLNMIGDDAHVGKLSSVYSFLNKCQTPMGKRLIHQQMTTPTFNETWLNREYDMTHVLLQNYHFVDLFRKQLTSVKDLDKILRQLVIRKVYPASIYHLYNSIAIVKQLNVCLFENQDLCEYFGLKYADLENLCYGLADFIDSHVDVELCRSAQSMSFEQNIIKRGVSDRLDMLIDKHINNIATLDGIQQYFNKLIGDDVIKKHEPEKSCVSLQLTKKRAGVLKNLISGGKDIDICGSKFNTSDVKFVSASTNAEELSFPILNSVTKELFKLKDEIAKVVGEVYGEFLENLELKWFETIEKISKYVSNMDVLQSKTYVARTYNYCRPEIDADAAKSNARAYGIRHCLIEHIQTNELYVANDIHIGRDGQDGMLLYGTNAVGKTSLIRALGIAVVLAQCGMYVPCSRFTYKPYTAIYSRILGNDNLFKGLSTFAVEMSELRVILKMSDQNSLILGDEVCSGTETESALSIFVSALMDLTKKGSSFIFATHFHEIVRYDEVKQIPTMVLCHMAVTYDRERDCLIYDRKLAAGPGDRMYGLEVCKSLYLDEAFLTQAYAIRNKYFPENRGELSNKSTVYNGKKVRGICEMCKSEIAGEVHHMSPQKDASPDGHIGTFHKNHKANLLSVCEKCHDLIHAKETVLVRKKTTKGYIVK
jgi:DNA mismatch repair protein MutS